MNVACGYFVPAPLLAFGTVPGVAGVGVVPGVGGGVMSGVPGVEGTPGVDGFPKPVPVPMPVPVPVPIELSEPGAPRLVASMPKCAYTRWLQVESIVGHVEALKVGALCNRARSTLAMYWSVPLELISRQGTATSRPPAGVP